MPTLIERYVSTGWSVGTTPPRQLYDSGQCLALVIGYVGNWNIKLAEGSSNLLIHQTYLEPRPNVMIIKQFELRGGDENGNFYIKFGMVDAPDKVRRKRTSSLTTIDLDAPNVKPTYKLANFTDVHRDQVKMDDFMTWNGIMSTSNLNVAIHPNKNLYFLFPNLCAQDKVYLYMIYERRIRYEGV
jgi:hypothetical protein